MRVAFLTTVFASGLANSSVDGIGSYTRELGAALARRESISLVPVGFRLVAPMSAIPGSESEELLGPYAPEALRSALTGLSFPEGRLSSRQVDIIHATDHLIPKYRSLPVVATLMDAIPLSHPEWVRMRFASAKRWLWRRAASWADQVLTISEYSKEEIVRHFGISPEKISVTPLGVDSRYFNVIDESVRREIQKRLSLPDAFFLFVGTLQPRKNLEHLLDAHAMLPARIQSAIPLVVVGRAGWGCEALVARLGDEQASRHVRWLRYLPDEDLRSLLQSATALVFPSLCEGFGLPVVEAFASGLPVIASNSTSIPEVAGDAAILVDPLNSKAMAEAMEGLINTPGLASKLSEAGLRRARMFTWDACADATLGAYRQILAT